MLFISIISAIIDFQFEPESNSGCCPSHCFALCLPLSPFLSILLSLSRGLLICLSVYLSLSLTVYPFLCLSVCLSFSLALACVAYISIYLSVCVPLSLSFPLPLALAFLQCLSVYINFIICKRGHKTWHQVNFCSTHTLTVRIPFPPVPHSPLEFFAIFQLVRSLPPSPLLASIFLSGVRVFWMNVQIKFNLIANFMSQILRFTWDYPVHTHTHTHKYTHTLSLSYTHRQTGPHMLCIAHFYDPQMVLSAHTPRRLRLPQSLLPPSPPAPAAPPACW